MPAPENKASLGCGTLILIALIVMIFGNSNRDIDKDLKRQVTVLQSEVGELRTEVRSLQTTISSQSASLAEVKKSLEELIKRSTQAHPGITPEAPLPEN